MPYFYPCPDCGANLDPGEKCDCKKTNTTMAIFYDMKNYQLNQKIKEEKTNVRNQNHDHSSGINRSN